jgi:hypothetical protein
MPPNFRAFVVLHSFEPKTLFDVIWILQSARDQKANQCFA